MLSTKEIKKIDEAIEKLEAVEVINMAKKMGIKIDSSNRSYHRVKNSNGEYEKLNMNKHFKINLEDDITRENNYFYSCQEYAKKDFEINSYALAV